MRSDQAASNVLSRFAMALSLAREFRGVGILISIPVILSAINSNWLYTKVGPLDPWYNVAYFLHYDDPSFLNDIYKIARLSWIIPGFVAYQVFSPVVANYVLHMGCLVISVVFLFLTLHRLFGYRIAFATAA